jgi:hypothetical protein
MADRYLIRDLTAPAGYVIRPPSLSTVFCSVQVPENIQKKLAHNESLRKLKAEAIEKKIKVCFR